MKRLWGIRHVRWLWKAVRVWHWAAAWGRAGIGMGVPNPADLQYLDLVWRGEA